ncbi:hypothetical protein FB45DRAFT_1037225 [Roridomyces roridus]|uniref:Uncharacterized protein n=1 Tax=Roridomyces roridus TaxID=1738132 RepID=A0AAD7B7C2_9AGAR|nr:hypothetical protein FB45DRAFT_1037225 [Roridomyces roridus]
MSSNGRLSGAQRQAAYRQRHRDDVLAQGRSYAGQRRAKCKNNPASHAAAKIQANQYAVGYRETNRAGLAHKEMIRRCRKSIDKIGYDAWLQTWQRRHPDEPPPYVHADNNPDDTAPSLSVNDGDKLEISVESRLSGAKLERYRRIKERHRLADLERLEWQQGMAELAALDDEEEDVEEDLEQCKLEHYRRRKEVRLLSDLGELEWAQEMAHLDAVLVGHAADDDQGGVDNGEYFWAD